MTEALTTEGFVYFIQVGTDGPVKIGWSTDVKRRCASLQNAHPERLHVRMALPTVQATERVFHDLFADARIRGEWFGPEVCDPVYLEARAQEIEQQRVAA